MCEQILWIAGLVEKYRNKWRRLDLWRETLEIKTICGVINIYTEECYAGDKKTRIHLLSEEIYGSCVR